MASEEQKYTSARRDMIRRHLQDRGVSDQRVREAFECVPREMFLDETQRRDAYVDSPLPIGCGQTISQPYIVGLMLQELDVHPDHRVLDVGSGSGYQTALLSHLARDIHAVERLDTLAARSVETLGRLGVANATVHVGDGSLGLPDFAPFDRIICGAASPDVPPAWIEQLADGGIIIVPTGPRDVQTLLRVEKRGEKLRRVEICGVRFVPLLGEQGWR
jgi:protein-L-isoaspartate(D-aspartate) O-methyltransferase